MKQRRQSAPQRGFTLLEVLVATLIMAIAVTGLLSAISTSMRSAARLTDYDRAALFARQKMDELLLAQSLRKNIPIEGDGWRARLTTFDKPDKGGPGTPVLERVELEVWWMNGEQRRTFTLEGFRRGKLLPEEVPQ